MATILKKEFLNSTTWCVNKHFYENKLVLRLGFDGVP